MFLQEWLSLCSDHYFSECVSPISGENILMNVSNLNGFYWAEKSLLLVFLLLLIQASIC
jgi:hypothetical protein